MQRASDCISNYDSKGIFKKPEFQEHFALVLFADHFCFSSIFLEDSTAFHSVTKYFPRPFEFYSRILSHRLELFKMAKTCYLKLQGPGFPSTKSSLFMKVNHE